MTGSTLTIPSGIVVGLSLCPRADYFTVGETALAVRYVEIMIGPIVLSIAFGKQQSTVLDAQV